MVARAQQLHVAQAVVEMRLHLGAEILLIELHQAGNVRAVAGDHGRAQEIARGRVGLQRQDGQRALVAKALVRHVMVLQRVAHAADDDAAAKVRHLRCHAQHAAHGRKAAVRRHHQRRRQGRRIDPHAPFVYLVVHSTCATAAPPG